MRVSELAKALNMTSKELLVKLKEHRIVAKSAMSTLDADAVNRVRKALVKKAPPKKPPAAAPRVAQAGAPSGPKAAAAKAVRFRAAPQNPRTERGTRSSGASALSFWAVPSR